MAADGDFSWPSAGTFVSANGENLMAVHTQLRTGYLLNGASPGPAKPRVRSSAGLLGNRLPTVRVVWLVNGLQACRAPFGVEWLKRGLRRPK